MPRHRRVRRDIPGDSDVGGDVTMGDVSDATLPEAVPRNADGTPMEEGEVSEEQAQLIGSLSLESAGKTKGVARRLRDKALGKKGVAWNVDDALEMFSYIRAVFAAEWNSIAIHITRADPAPKVQLPPIMASNLKDPRALYDYVEQHHGPQGPATYKVYFRAGAGHERGSASIYMPDKSAPPVVQVVSQPQQSPQQQPQYAPQYAPHGYPPPQYAGGGGYGPPPQGGAPPSQGGGYPWPPQQQPQREIVVISPPAQQAAPQPQQAAPLPPAPPPQPIFMQPPAPAPGAFDPQRAMFDMMQQQSAQMMATLEKVVERLNKPQPPPGFIALPSEQYPVPPGFVRVPGGMIPAPNMAAYVPAPAPAQASPQGVGAAPVAYSVPAQAPAPVVVQAPPAPTFDQQIQGTVGMMKGVVRGMGELQNLFSTFGPQGGPQGGNLEPDVEEEEPPPPNPLITTDVGGITMAIDRATGKTNWPATLMGAIPKIVDTGKSALHEYQKMMDRQNAQTAQLVQQRINLANAVKAAQTPQQPALQQAPQQAPQPQIQVRPAPPPQAAASVPASVPARPAQPVPVKKPSVPMPNGPIWGSS